MLFETRDVPLKFRFILLTRKYLTKCFSREFNPVTESLNSLRLAAFRSTARIKLLISLPIFKHYNCLLHYRKIIHNLSFLPLFFMTSTPLCFLLGLA